MPARSLLITGANGELGHYLIDALSAKDFKIYTIDKRSLDPKLSPKIHLSVKGDIGNPEFIRTFFEHHSIDVIIHLAAVLSTKGESDPTVAHQVNTDGTFFLLDAATKQAELQKRITRFVFPSSVAVYGLPDLETKKYSGSVRESDFIQPQSMYGCTKLYSELVGSYISNHRSGSDTGLSFIALRFPTLIGPSLHDHSGTGDFAAEMVHAVISSNTYTCFVRADSQIPFLAMPDAVKALVTAISLPGSRLSQNTYNLSGFSVSAADIATYLHKFNPYFQVTYSPDPIKQRIVDSWPEDLDDLPARQDWDWQPDYDMQKTIANFILPTLKRNNPDYVINNQ